MTTACLASGSSRTSTHSSTTALKMDSPLKLSALAQMFFVQDSRIVCASLFGHRTQKDSGLEKHNRTCDLPAHLFGYTVLYPLKAAYNSCWNCFIPTLSNPTRKSLWKNDRIYNIYISCPSGHISLSRPVYKRFTTSSS